jgi:hypothetical protein
MILPALTPQQIARTGLHPRGHQPKPISEVSVAGLRDHDDLMRFLDQVRDELIVDDADLLSEIAAALVSRNNGVAFIVRGQSDPIEASLGLILTRMSPLSRRYQLLSAWNLVLPEHRRRSGHAKSLLIAAKAFAERMGMPIFFEEAGTPDSPKGKLCSRHLSLVRVVFSTTAPVAV